MGEQFSNDFGGALSALKAGKKVTRAGWNGKDMFLYFVAAASYNATSEVAKTFFGETVLYGAYIAIKTVDGTVLPWVASQSDLLAQDWSVVE